MNVKKIALIGALSGAMTGCSSYYSEYEVVAPPPARVIVVPASTVVVPAYRPVYYRPYWGHPFPHRHHYHGR